MAVTLPGLSGGSPISTDLLYRFYDNKAITPQVRAALQKREDMELNGDSGSSDSDSEYSGMSAKSMFGPATKVDITQQIIRMNIADKTPSMKKEESLEEMANKKTKHYDALTEIKRRIATETIASNKAKDEKLQEISDKVTESETPAEETEATEG